MPESTSTDVEVREIDTLRETLVEQGNALREMRERPVEERSENWSRELRDTAHLIYALDAEMRAAEIEERAARDARLREQGSGAGRATGGAETRSDGVERRSIGDQVVESEAFKQWSAVSHGSGTSPDIEVRAPVVIAGDPYLIGEGPYLDPNSSAGLFVPRGTPYLPDTAIDRRRLFIRDLLAGGNTTLQAIPYIRELTPRTFETGATSIPEGTAKPNVFIQFAQDLAPVRKLGAWVPVTSEILEDAPTLSSYINGRLGYMVRVREEEQLVNGSGTGADIRGITQTPNIQTQAIVTAGDFQSTVAAAIGKIENVDGDADGMAMNPIDFWTMVSSRFATQLDNSPVVAGGTGQGLPYGDAPNSLWGLPCVRTRTLALGQALIGAYKTGAQLFDRSGMSIRVGDQHADYFTNNKVAVLCEERLALAVYRPDWFVLATLH